jgi:hypothetical protein
MLMGHIVFIRIKDQFAAALEALAIRHVTKYANAIQKHALMVDHALTV